MTLKAFHIVFITFSTLLALSCGGWCLWLRLMTGESTYVSGAIAGFICAVALLVYGIWFWKKMKRLRLIT